MENKRTRESNKRQKTSTQLFAPMAKILLFLFIFGLIVWSILKTDPTQFLEAEVSWNIDEKLPINRTVLVDKIQPLIQDKYQLDLLQIKQVLEKDPWIENAYIKRLFWNSIQINIKSKEIMMRWENITCHSENEKNCMGYISTNGELFIPKKMIESTAVLARSKPNKEIIFKLYQDYKEYQQQVSPMVIRSFSKTHIDRLILEPNVEVILGYQNQKDRLNKFIKAYQKLTKETSKVKKAVFDMRYPKGFSLRYLH